MENYTEITVYKSTRIFNSEIKIVRVLERRAHSAIANILEMSGGTDAKYLL